MNFWFCETCGKRLTEQDIEAGAARNKKLNGVFCQQCSVGVMTMEFAALSDVKIRETPAFNTVTPARSDKPRSEELHAPKTVRPKPSILPAVVGVSVALVLLTVFALTPFSSRPTAKTVSEKLNVTPIQPVDTAVAPAAAPVAVEQPVVAPKEPDAETLAKQAFEKLIAFEHSPVGDKAARIAVTEEFLKIHGETIIAARARVLLAELKKGAEPVRAPEPVVTDSNPNNAEAKEAKVVPDAPPVMDQRVDKGRELTATVNQDGREAAATEAWKKAEGLFAAKNWAAARKAYDLFQLDFAGTALLAAQSEALKARLESIDEKVAASHEIAVDLNGIKMELVLIPAGEFVMGSDDGEANERPAHRVKISKPFYMSKYVVTQAQYEKVIHKNPSHVKSGDNFPVDYVDHADAIVFCKQVGKLIGKSVRLPTEAEWEYACRAGTKTKFYTGDSKAALEQAGWNDRSSGAKPQPVGQKKPNAWGLYDMHGCVWQWCSDWYGDNYYQNSPAEDPEGPSPPQPVSKDVKHVLRGGAWSESFNACRSAFRLNKPYGRYSCIGVRIVIPTGTK